MPGKIGHLRPLCMCWKYMGVDFQISWFKMVFILTQWGMEVFHVFSYVLIVFAFAMIWRYHWSSLHFFPVWWAFSLSFSFNFHAHLRRTAKLNCLSLRRWTTLAMPGWQAPRLAPWMATPTRAGGTFSSWNSMPRACTSGRASAVGKTLTLLRLCRRTGCEVVFESFPLRKSFRFSCEVPCSESGGMASHSNWPICWVPLQGRYHDNSRYLIYPASREVSRGTLSDYFRL